MQIYHTQTKEDYDALMIELEDKGAEWLTGEKATDGERWGIHEERSCIFLENNIIEYARIGFFKRDYPDIPIQKYKAGTGVRILKQDIGKALRSSHNHTFKEDLKKAQWYLQGAIDKLEDN